jgi:hypothetical protein
MPIILPEQKQFEKAPTGTHIATCYQVIDLGSQISDYGKGETKINRKVRLTWELPHATMTDGKPFSIGKDYTLSSNEKSNLVSDINAWRGKPFTAAEFGAFDIEKLIGKCCFLQVVHKTSAAGKLSARVNAIMALPPGQSSVPMINKPLTFSLATFDPAALAEVAEYWRNQIMASPEYKQLVGQDDGHNDPMPEMHEEAPF